MTGNPCGDYTLSLKFPEEAVTDVCTEGVLYKGDLDENDSLSIDLWFQGYAKFSFSCYMWCTEDGHMPKQPSGQTGDTSGALFLSLVRHTHDQIVYKI